MSPILPELPEYLRRRAAEIKLLIMDNLTDRKSVV